MSAQDTRYDADFLAWTREQAHALREAARVDIPDGSDRGIDWGNLADEIESLGMSERSALHSEVRRVAQHLLNLEFSPAGAPRNGWRRSVREARVAIAGILERNPSLRPAFGDIVAAETAATTGLALGDLEDHRETEAAARLRASARSYNPETQILADWWPKDPRT